MSKGSQLLSASTAFALIAASVYLVTASWNDPAAVIDLLTGLLPAIFGGGITNVLAMVVLVLIAMFALLFHGLRRNERAPSRMAASLSCHVRAVAQAHTEIPLAHGGELQHVVCTHLDQLVIQDSAAVALPTGEGVRQWLTRKVRERAR